MFLFLFGLTLIHSTQTNLLDISTVIINTSTVITCGSSIDIYPTFDPAQVIICPYVRVDEDKIQWIYLNICKFIIVYSLLQIKSYCFSAFDIQTNQLIIYSNPALQFTPKILIKSSNNSLISPTNLTQTSIYYLSFSSELLCRFDRINPTTICFYYPISSNFLSIEYHYDQIQHGSLMLPTKARHRFYMIFVFIVLMSSIIFVLALCVICRQRSTFFHPTPFDLILDRQIARQEAAKRPTDPAQDGATGYPQPVDQREIHAFIEH